MQKIQLKTIHLNEKIPKGGSLYFSSEGSSVSVVCSCKGRRSVFSINQRDFSENSDSFKIYDFNSSSVDIKVKRGALFIDRIIFWKEKRTERQKAKRKPSGLYRIRGELF